MFDVERVRLVAAAGSHKVPTMYYVSDFVLIGRLFSYGPNFDETAIQVGTYISRILKGAKPADLPIQQPTKFELVINTTASCGFLAGRFANHSQLADVLLSQKRTSAGFEAQPSLQPVATSSGPDKGQRKAETAKATLANANGAVIPVG
jgi:hypothetical protein